MTTLVWIIVGMSAIISGFIFYKIGYYFGKRFGYKDSAKIVKEECKVK
jgi:membrane protein DedA with SNARE-associated domain